MSSGHAPRPGSSGGRESWLLTPLRRADTERIRNLGRLREEHFSRNAVERTEQHGTGRSDLRVSALARALTPRSVRLATSRQGRLSGGYGPALDQALEDLPLHRAQPRLPGPSGEREPVVPELDQPTGSWRGVGSSRDRASGGLPPSLTLEKGPERLEVSKVRVGPTGGPPVRPRRSGAGPWPSHPRSPPGRDRRTGPGRSGGRARPFSGCSCRPCGGGRSSRPGPARPPRGGVSSRSSGPGRALGSPREHYRRARS